MSDSVEGLSQAALAQLARTRRTINDFDGRVPPREAVLRAIEVARWAPNHKLTEPWRFHLLGPETVEAVIGLNSQLLEPTKGADVAKARAEKWRKFPGWIVVTCRSSPQDRFREQEDYAAVSCAVQMLFLSLWSEGIGSKWSTNELLRDPKFLPLLKVDPQQEFVVALIWFGYPALTPPGRRREVNEIVVSHP